MDPTEIQARATIAAALITSHAVEVPTMPRSNQAKDTAAARLRELTDYVYLTITAPPKPQAVPPGDPASV